MDGNEIRRQLAEARTSRAKLFGEMENLRARGEVDGASDGLAERLANINRAVESADNRIAELEGELGRYHELEGMARDSRHIEGGHDDPAVELARLATGRDPDEHRDRALRTIERHSDRMDAEASDRIDGLVRRDDGRNWVARYVDAVGSDAYRSAFAKLAQDPQNGHLRFTPQEVEAVRVASQVESERAMSIGSGAGGGFLLPFALDPTIMISSAGALNPVRQVARTVVTPWNEWRGISSDGVTVSYSAEAAAMTDGSPVLAQPTITCRRWTAFVPFSWELGMDWPQLENELGGLIVDGRNVNDSVAFYSGTSSSNQPNGIMNGIGASQQILTVATALLTTSDVWALKESVPARWISSSEFLFHPNVLDKAFRLVANASTSEPDFMPERGGPIVGRPVYEWSSLGGTVGTGSTIGLAGDFSAGYVIADRLGLTAVPVPVLFSGNTAGSFGYPTGQSGLVVWGRTGAGVVNANALRVLTGR
jgi:HK97 family phage major capsid protein